MIPISVIILTLNEEANLIPCLDSLAQFDDIHVLDSGSTDRTCQWAEARGIPVHEHAFSGFGSQRNWAIDHIPAKYDWHLHLDADERMTSELAEELRNLIARNPPEGGFWMPSRLMLGESWLKYAGGYPVYQVRLFHRQRLRFVDHGHGQREVTEQPLGKISRPYLHYAFSKGLGPWLIKHVDYARREAEAACQDRIPIGQAVRQLAGRSNIQRRRALKSLTWRMPFRPTLRLLYHLVVKRAFLDGRAGITYSKMMAAYEAMAELFYRGLSQADSQMVPTTAESESRETSGTEPRSTPNSAESAKP